MRSTFISLVIRACVRGGGGGGAGGRRAAAAPLGARVGKKGTRLPWLRRGAAGGRALQPAAQPRASTRRSVAARIRRIAAE